MQFSDLVKRAVEIRNKYQKFEEETYGHSWGREQIMEGFVGDVGALMKVVMVKEGHRCLGEKDADEELKHQLSDCLWSLLVLSQKYDIDIETEFMKTMDTLEQRINDKEKH